MQKIPSVFKRDYEGTRLMYDEVVPGCEWVLAGEGVATVKWDGTCCRTRNGQLWQRYDRKPTREARRRGKPYVSVDDFKPAPEGWEAAEDKPNLHTGHWPGWVPVGEGPEDQHHRAALARWGPGADGTYELVGPKVQGNPHGLRVLHLMPHGDKVIGEPPGERTFEGIRAKVERVRKAEGLVYHHPDGRMAKVKRKDFGFAWPEVP
jgi:hypothetical protein